MDATLPKTKRSRSRATSSGKRLHPSPRDVAIVRALYEHGPLPTEHLHKLVAHDTNYIRFQKRIGDLFHEDNTPHGGAYLLRPWQLNPDVDKAHYVVSEASDAGIELLREFAQLNPEAKASAGGSYPHMFMTACITASLELGIRAAGLRFIPRSEIMADAPTKTLAIPAPITHTFKGGKRLSHDKPISADGIFGIEYPSGGKIYFLIETDLNNEPLRRQDFQTTSYLRKVLQYKEAIGGSRYKATLGIDQRLVVLTYTTNVMHSQNLRDMVMEELGATNYLLFAALPQFDGSFRVPHVIETIATMPYARAGKPDFLLTSFA